MIQCKKCEYFLGYDHADGTTICDYPGGYENCPYCDESNVKSDGVTIQIDSGFMSDYIKATIMNTIERSAKDIASEKIKSIITDELRNEILSEMEAGIKSAVAKEIENFFKGEITVGGGWMNPERKLKRNEYLSELVQDELKKKFDGSTSTLREEVSKAARNEIEKFSKKLRDDINSQIKQVFSDTTRQALTDSVVNMLMCNDTYKKLAESMEKLLPDGK